MSEAFGVSIQIILNAAELFGIYAIAALSLNLEYGYTGVPNFGKVFFIGLGAFITGTTVAHSIAWLVSQSVEICSGSAGLARLRFADSSPVILTGIFLLTILISALVTGAFGYLLSYPALRLRADYLGILLIATGELLRVFVRASPANGIACESDSLVSISNPFLWVRRFAPPFAPTLPPPFDWVTAPILLDASYVAVILAVAIACYLIVTRLTNSPYGRMLKAVRDDEPAAISLGKAPAKVRGQVMVIGSAMAGIAGTLFAFKVQAVDTSSFIPLLTFIVWAIVLLGGAANNRGVILGVIVYVSIDFLTFVGKTYAIANNPLFRTLILRAPIDTYAQQMALGVLIILVILFRPQGILPEKPIRTPAWEVIKRVTGADGKKSE